MLTFCSWWGGYFNKTGFEHWKSIKNVSRMKILHCREVPLISVETGRQIIILSMILLYCNFIHHGLLKVAFDLLWLCAGKRFPCKDQMNVIKDLTNAEWKHFVGKSRILKDSKRTFQKKFRYLTQKHRIYFSKQKRFLCCDNLAFSTGQLDVVTIPGQEYHPKPSAPWENKELSYLG